MADRVVLVRHGQTEWSETHRHTGRTDLPLTDLGRRRAEALGPVLGAVAGIDEATVVTSPLLRARETCRLAGLGERAEIWPDLTEWDYGVAEGRTTAELRTQTPGWSVWTHEIEGGESLDQVGRRAERVIAAFDRTPGLVVVFAHAHLLRILGSCWCGWGAAGGQHLTMDAASTSELGFEREARVLLRWNALPEAVRRTASLAETGEATSRPQA